MGRPFQSRRAARVGSSNRSSCNCHPRSVNQSTGGNTTTAANRATRGTQAQSTQTPAGQDKADQVQLSTRQEEHAAGAQAAGQAQGGGFNSFLGNLAGNLGLEGISQKLTPLKLDDKDKALLGKAQDIHKKLAGADGVWDASDKARNLEQMKGDLGRIVDQEIGEQFQQRTQGRTRVGTRFKQAIGRMHMKNHYGEDKAQGMGQANAQASAGLKDGQRQLGISDKTAAHKAGGPEKIQPVTVAELETFGSAMKRLEELGKAQGKPSVKFTQGLPNEFFSDVLGGKLIPAGVDLTGGQ